MLAAQKVYLFLIIIPGAALGISALFLKKDIGLWLIKYGLIVAIPGVLFSVLFGKQVLDVLLLIDVGGFGRAYIVGCMLVLAGVVVQGWYVISSSKKKK